MAGRLGAAAEERCSQGGCLTPCMAMVNTSSSTQQGEPSQHPPAHPPALLKPRRQFGGLMQQREGKEDVTMCLQRAHPAPPALQISPAPGTVSRSQTLLACIFRKQRALMDAPSLELRRASGCRLAGRRDAKDTSPHFCIFCNIFKKLLIKRQTRLDCCLE